MIKVDWIKEINIEKSNSFGIGIILLQMNLLLDENKTKDIMNDLITMNTKLQSKNILLV